MSSPISLPLNPAQRWLFRYFTPPFKWFDSLSFTMTTPVSVERVEQTLQTLIRRHAGLRISFAHTEQGWKQLLHENVPEDLYTLLVVSLKEDPKEPLQKQLEKSQTFICDNFDIQQLPLFKLILIEQNKNQFLFHFIFHHIIVDYVSIVIFFKEFYHLYFHPCESLSEPASLLTYSKEIQVLENSIDRKKLSYYQMHKDIDWLGLSPSIQRPSLEQYGERLYQTLSFEASDTLLRLARGYFKKQGLHAILAAPLYQAIQQMTGKSSVCISHKLHGRALKPNDIRLFSVIGNFAINVPITCLVSPQEPWNVLVDFVDRSLSEDPSQNMLYDLAADYLSADVYPDQLIAPVRFNFMGTMSFGIPPFLQIDFHKFAQRVPMPNQILTTFIEFFIYFSEKQLFVEMLSDRLSIKHNLQERLMENYIQQIIKLVDEINKDAQLCQIQS